MCFDGADWHCSDFSDRRKVEFLDKAQDEDSALTLREGCYGLPEVLNLLPGDEGGFSRGGLVWDKAGKVMRIDGGARDLFPKAESVGSGMVADEVKGNARQPGCGGTISAELFSCRPGADEGVLGK